MEKHELSKIDFEIIENAFKALLQSHSDPVTADKVADLRDKFRDAYAGWLEIYNEGVTQGPRGQARMRFTVY